MTTEFLTLKICHAIDQVLLFVSILILQLCRVQPEVRPVAERTLQEIARASQPVDSAGKSFDRFFFLFIRPKGRIFFFPKNCNPIFLDF